MSSNTYRKMFRRKQMMLVKCPRCGVKMNLHDYVTEHVRQVHHVDRDTQCPFCIGAFRFRRKEGTAAPINRHRMECIKETFPDLFQRPKGHKVTVLPPPVSVSGHCRECRSFLQFPKKRGLSGRNRFEEWGTFYEEVGQLPPFLTGPLLPTHVSYSEESGLGDFMYPILHQFRQQTHMWYHVSVRAAAWKDFVKHVLSKKGVYVLPYWCLCDGSKTPHAKLPASQKHHRHMVLVKDKKVQLEKEWKTCIKVKDTAAKLKIPIKTIHQLIHTLFYVSRSRARCDGTAGKMDVDEGHSHYYLPHQMYPHAKVAMYTLVPNGLSEYIHFRGKQHKARHWYEQVKGTGGDRSIPVKTLDIPISGCVVPFAKHLEPSHLTEGEPPPTDRPYLWMFKSDDVLVLKSNPSLLEMGFEDWYAHQMKCGNSFLDAVHNEKYALGQRHRTDVNDFQSIKHELMEVFKEEKSTLLQALETERSHTVSVHEKMEHQHAKYLEMENELQKCLKERDDERMQRQYLERTTEAVEAAVERVRNQMSEAEKVRMQQYEDSIAVMSEEINALKSQLKKAEEARIQQYETRIAELKEAQRVRVQQYEDRIAVMETQMEAMQQLAQGVVSVISKRN